MSTTHPDSVEASSSGHGVAHSGPDERDDEQSLGLMIGISAGHGIKHFGQGALLVMMPFIRSTFAIGDVAYGTLFAISSISSGIANVPAGMLADMYRKRVAWLLTISMLMVGAGYFLIGISPWVWLIALAIAGSGLRD